MKMRIISMVSALIVFQMFPVTIVLDPAGDARYAGRSLGESFERGITLQCVMALEGRLKERFPQLIVAISRLPGETVSELQSAQFANKLDADLFVSIHFFKETEPLPRWYFYTFAGADDCPVKSNDLSLYHVDQAHLLNKSATQELMRPAVDVLTKRYHARLMNCVGLFSLPCKPLIGVKAPACMIEIGLKESDAWRSCVEPLETYIAYLLTKEHR